MKKLLIILIFNLFLFADNAANIISLNNIKKVVQKEEYIALAINKYLLENLRVPKTADNKIDWEILKTPNYLGVNFNIINVYTQENVEVYFENNYAYIQGAIYNPEEYEETKKYVYTYYADDIYRINTFAPKDITPINLAKGALVKYGNLQKEIIQIINNSDDPFSTSATCTPGTKFYEIYGEQLLYKYCKAPYDTFDIYQDGVKTITAQSLQDLRLMQAPIGTPAYVKTDGKWEEYYYQGNIEETNWIKKEDVVKNEFEDNPGGGNGYSALPVEVAAGIKELIIRPDQGCYLAGGDIYCWGKNNFNKIGISNLQLPTNEIYYLQTPVMLKSTLNDNLVSNLLSSVLGIVNSLLSGLLGGSSSLNISDWFNSEFRNEYISVGLNNENVCGVSKDFKLFCTGKITNSEILKELRSSVKDVAMINDTILILDTNNDLYTLGSNEKGAMGLDNQDLTRIYTNFVKISSSYKFSKVFALRNSKTFAALDTDNRLWIWGERGSNILYKPTIISNSLIIEDVVVNDTEFTFKGTNGNFYVTEDSSNYRQIENTIDPLKIVSTKVNNSNIYLYPNTKSELNETITSSLVCKNADGTLCNQADTDLFNDAISKLTRISNVAVFNQSTQSSIGVESFSLEFEPWPGTIDLSGITNTSPTYGDDQLYINGSSNNKIDMKSGDDIVYINGNLNDDIELGSGDDQLEIAGDSNDKIDAEIGSDKIKINGNSNRSIDGGYLSGEDEIVILGSSNGDIKTGNGNDKISISGNLNGEIDTGNDNDQIQIYGNVNGGGKVDTGYGDDTVYIDGDLNAELDTDDGDDKVIITGNINAEIDLGSDDDVIKVDGNIWRNIDGGRGSDSIILGNYTKADYDLSWSVRTKLESFENILFKDGVIIGDSSVFDN